MSTENMRKLMMLAENIDHEWNEDRDYHEEWIQHFVDMGKSKLWSLYNDTLEDEDYPGRTDELQHMEDALERMGIVVAEGYEDEACPHCHGWGEWIDPEGFDEPVPCPHCDPDDEPIRKSRLVKDMAMDMDMDWTDLGLADVDPADLKGFPKVEEDEWDVEDFPVNESFTRKHFRMVADTLQKIEDPEVRRAQAEEYAAQFAAANPRFNRDLFMQAAGVEELEEGWDDMDRTFVAPGKTKKDKPCPSCGGLSFEYEITGHCPDCEEDEELTEEQSEFRLAQIVGKDNFAELVSDLNTGGIDYTAAYFQPLYWHFLDEYPDEIPVGARTGRPDDPEDYVLDNIERYHSDEIKQYMQIPDMDESRCGVCGEEFKWEGSPDEEMCPRCTKEYLGEESCPCGKEGCECGPDCDCEPVEEGFTLDAIVESLLDERGQPKDYEMSDEELAAEIEDETSEFERDSIDKEIEDEELGLRFD